MARKRMIDPSFWRDEKIGQCTYMERLLFEGLWTFAEDHGVGRANPLLLKADIFPYDIPLREADIEKSLVKLASLGLILLYERDGQKYYFVINFKKHQTINKPTPSTLPEPLPEDYGSATVVVTSQKKIKEEKEKLREEEVNTARAMRFTPPTYDEVAAYVAERQSNVDPQGFIDFYESKGWLVGKTPMKNWKAACRNAERWERWGKTAAPNTAKSKTFTDALREEGLI